MRILSIFLLVLFNATGNLLADGEADNSAENVRRVPPKGVEVPEEVREKLSAGLAELAALMEPVKAHPLFPDVGIYHKAVDWSLRYGEFFDANKEFGIAEKLLEQGKARARDLAAGRSPWTEETGLVVRGYRSQIDGSLQPYGLVVPESVKSDPSRKRRLDFWLHGRGEQVTELNFIQQRQSNAGQFVPGDTLVLHPFGRYCNANKLAGEVDLFEALAHARSQYAIDEDRLVVRGFSMGGAACWQFAVHYAGMWAAAQPGAGFSETENFLKVFQNEEIQPSWYERKLLHLYDCTDWAGNLRHCPTVAYSGEIDRQKQAAERMEASLLALGIGLTHIIGPGMGHQIDDASAREIDRRIDAIATKGRENMPESLNFTTYTLRYDRMKWLQIDGLEKHWERTHVQANLGGDGVLRVQTENVSALTIDIQPGQLPRQITAVRIDDQILPPPLTPSDKSWRFSMCKADGVKWQGGEFSGLRKKHGLQGPIDDAFMDSFIMVEPGGVPANDKAGVWVQAEMARAKAQWRQHFRGDAPVKKDSEISEEDIANHHLILWGDAASNAVLARLIGQLPDIGVDPAKDQAAIMIYPNPLNPEKYVVLNSGFTWREYDYLNNARQVPKLPDWAVIDVTQPATSRHPGGIVDAGFFDENWKRVKSSNSDH